MYSIDESKYRKRTCGIQWVVVHYTAMPNSNKETVASYFERTSRCVSTHYVVDSGGWMQLLDVCNVAFHCGSMNTSICGAGNGNSIGVDMCERKRDVRSIKVGDKDWYFDEGTLQNAAELCAYLLIEHGLGIERLVRHYDVTHKQCPAPFVCEWIKDPVSGLNGPQQWVMFKTRVADIMSQMRCAKAEANGSGTNSDLKGLAEWENQ